MATIESPTPSGETVLSGLTEAGIVLEGVSWETYERLLVGIGDQHVFVTYSDGTMEVEMSPRRKHEGGIGVLVALINAIRLLRGVAMESGGSTTHKHPELRKGVEPDACFWIANESRMRGVDDLDLTKHPAPDLVIEVDVTNSSVDRIGVFDSLGVPEIWWCVANEVKILTRGEKGGYQEAPKSLSFEYVTPGALGNVLKNSKELGETAALEQLLQELGLR